MRLRTLIDPDYLPALDPRYAVERPALGLGDGHPPRILLLYGSLREQPSSAGTLDAHVHDPESVLSRHGL